MMTFTINTNTNLKRENVFTARPDYILPAAAPDRALAFDNTSTMALLVDGSSLSNACMSNRSSKKIWAENCCQCEQMH